MTKEAANHGRHHKAGGARGKPGPAVGGALAALVALALLLGPASPAFATNGVEFISNSTKGSGRGGAEIAVGNDVLASPHNPATLAESRRLRIDGNIGFFFERVRETTPFEDELTSQLVSALPSFGLVWDPFSEPPSDDAPFGTSSRFRVGFCLWQPIALVVSPTFSLAFQATDTLAFGVSVHPLFTYLDLQIRATASGGDPNAELDFVPKGSVFVHRRPDDTPVSPPEPFDAGTGTQVTWEEVFRLASSTGGAGPSSPAPAPNVTLKLQRVTGYGIAGQFGLLWSPLPDLAFGASYRTPGVIASPEGEALIDLSRAILALKVNPTVGELLDQAFETYLPRGGADGYAAKYKLSGSDLQLPAVIGVGTAWSPIPPLLLAFDFRFIHWTATTNRIKLRGQRGNNRDFNEINGGPTLDYTIKLDWEDAYVFAVGLAYSPLDWLVLRSGFNHGNSPVSKDFLEGNSLGTEDHLTFGAGVVVGSWEVDLAYVYGLPTQIRFEAERTRSTSEQHFLYLGVSYQF